MLNLVVRKVTSRL